MPFPTEETAAMTSSSSSLVPSAATGTNCAASYSFSPSFTMLPTCISNAPWYCFSSPLIRTTSLIWISRSISSVGCQRTPFRGPSLSEN